MAHHGWSSHERQLRFIITSVALVGILSVAGCSSSPKSGSGKLLMFPYPPAEPRVQYLSWAGGAREVEESYGDFVEFVLGADPDNLQRITRPYGIAVHEGVAYVCDVGLPSICRLDYAKREFSVFGVRGLGRLRMPVNLTVDALGYKFVADKGRKEIVVFGPDDEFVKAHKVPTPCFPVDVAVWQDELFVLDNDNTCQIVVLDRETGEQRRTIGGPGAEPGQFWKPNSLAIGPDGNLYVSDLMNARIQKLSRDGEVIWVSGRPGDRLGQFVRPRGIRVGPDGVIYVVDAGTAIVQMYNDEGQVLMHFGGWGDVPGALDLPACVAVDRTSIPYFKPLVHKNFEVEYLLFVTSQSGRHAVTVYAFGAFPEGYELGSAKIEELPPTPEEDSFQNRRTRTGPRPPSDAAEEEVEPSAGDEPSDGRDTQPEAAE